MKSNQVFNSMRSNVGSQFAEPGFENRRPPRSAKLVVSVDMGSGPGGGDYRTYLLCTDKERSAWYLWLECGNYDYHLFGPSTYLYSEMVYGEPYRGIPAKRAAELLLTKDWEDDRDQGRLKGTIRLTIEGLLTAEDIHRIERAVYGSEKIKIRKLT